MRQDDPTESDPGARVPDEVLIQAFARLDKLALGLAMGLISSLAIFFATIFLLIKGGNQIGPNLALLGQFFIGYTVTWKGSMIGAGYGFVFGFMLGWLIALLRNTFVAIYIYAVKLKANLNSINDVIGDL